MGAQTPCQNHLFQTLSISEGEGEEKARNHFYTSLLRFKPVTFCSAVMMAELKNGERTSFGHRSNLLNALPQHQHTAHYITSTPSAIL